MLNPPQFREHFSFTVRRTEIYCSESRVSALVRAGLQFLEAFLWHFTGAAGFQPTAGGDSPVWTEWETLVSEYTDCIKISRKNNHCPKVRLLHSSTKCSGSAWWLLQGGTLWTCSINRWQIPSPPACWLCSCHPGQQRASSDLGHHGLLPWGPLQNTGGFSHAQSTQWLSKSSTISWFGRESFYLFIYSFVKFPLEYH